MSWFEEQIRQRKENDQDLFEDAFFEMATAVLGRREAGVLNDERIVTKAAIDEVLKYYHYKPEDIPENVKNPEEQLEYALRPHGLMYRRVTLSGKWDRDSFGPVMVYRKEDRLPVVLLPGTLRGYYWKDVDGNRYPVNKKNMEQFDTDAICFYKALPQRAIGIHDLITYMNNCLSIKDYAILIGLTLLVTVTGMMLPRLTRVLTGYVLEINSISILWITAVFMFCVLISSQLFSVSRELVMNRIQIKTALPVESAMMMRLMSLPAPFFKQYSSGELANRSGAVNSLSQLFWGGVISTAVTAVVSLLYVNQIFKYAPALAFPSLLVMIATVVVTLFAILLQSKTTKKRMERSAKESGMSFALISSIQKIRLAGAEKRAFARWAHSYAESAALEYNPPLFLKLNSSIILAVSLTGTIVLYYSAVRSGVSPSEYMAFNAAYGTVAGAFNSLSGIVAASSQIRPILKMAEPILKAEPETSENLEIVTKVFGGIELSNVSFRYNETMPYVINDMNLKIRSGEYLAIVGTTGCGKSTLIRLLLGFETPQKGAIYFDNRDLRSLDLRSLRRMMGVVTQDGKLFQGSIFSNIIVSAPHLTLTEAWEAAEMAGIADDIRAMPMGMHTIIGEGQGGISGGQKQRLLIARAIAPKPRILLFDEATGSLDNRTQKQISDSLDALKCTRVVIAHRLSTIKNCDRILVMDQGKIVEQGTYDSLIEENGLFAELVARQRVDA